jgi:hypothetical protein
MSSPVDPAGYGAPFERPGSTVSSSTDGAWRRRQTIKRGVTRKVKLTGGNFIAEYAVPTAVRNAVEPRYAATNTTEFTYAFRPVVPVDDLRTFFSAICATRLPQLIQMTSVQRMGGRSVLPTTTGLPKYSSPLPPTTRINFCILVRLHLFIRYKPLIVDQAPSTISC